jgi:hypothetical protein
LGSTACLHEKIKYAINCLTLDWINQKNEYNQLLGGKLDPLITAYYHDNIFNRHMASVVEMIHINLALWGIIYIPTFTFNLKQTDNIIQTALGIKHNSFGYNQNIITLDTRNLSTDKKREIVAILAHFYSTLKRIINAQNEVDMRMELEYNTSNTIIFKLYIATEATYFIEKIPRLYMEIK